ncbi:MAG TPA: fibronectin type III domain-containing protein, partial [Candidatus Cloacimonadota bacterium]|nr:fibronectin type III domain-containing protein [Candidatus Cloacimonadota bacterium]
MKYWIVVYFCLFSIFLYAQSIEMMPYLQTPTATSIYVSWFGSSSNQSVVQYGTTTSLGYSASGSVVSFNSSTKWHSVKLLNLAPNTLYYYQCI